jgi:hypothetical protein
MNQQDEMNALKEVTAAVVDGVKLSLADVLRHANTNNHLSFVKNAVDGYLIDRAAERLGIKVIDAEIEVIMGRVTSGKKLEGDEEIAAWLESSGLGQAGLRDNVRRMIRFGRLKKTLTEETMARLGPEVMAALTANKTKGTLRDLLFLQWLEAERKNAQIDIVLPRLVA